MTNFYTEERQFYLDRLDLETIVRDLEANFQGEEPHHLRSYEEALTWYRMVLLNAGDICANFIAPRAADVDEKGPTHHNGAVEYAPETKENMQVLAEAGYMGGTLPRKYGGLNLPVTIFNVIVEMVSQADASLMNLFGLQDIAVTIDKFGSTAQKERILPKFCRGEVTGSMALTEPDAGSDLQSVQLKAIEKDGQWYLEGVKRFITNGCGDVSLVLARSEPGSQGGRGLSMFLYESYRDNNLTIRRIEDKLGIHGSPTCELQFNMARAELVGKRKFGLIKYVMSLMNGARLAVSAQALGIAQAAYQEALAYAREREQFGHKIVHFPAVYQMLNQMRAELESSRLLLYDTARYVDLQDMYERKMDRGENVRSVYKATKALAEFLTPLSKFVTTEMANKVAYDALQIHGGCGYMRDFPIERIYRDARITNIYEGTTQLQVVAALAGIKSDVFAEKWQAFRELQMNRKQSEKQKICAYMDQYYQLIAKVKAVNSKPFFDYVGNYLVELVSILYRLTLFLPVAEAHPSKDEVFTFYQQTAQVRMTYLINIITQLADNYGDQIEHLKKPFLDTN